MGTHPGDLSPAFVLPDRWKTVRLVTCRRVGWIHAAAVAEVIESLLQGFRALGIVADNRENEVDQAAVNIFFTAHGMCESDATQLPANSIIYNFDQVGGTVQLLTPPFLTVIARHRVWDYSSRNMERLKPFIGHDRCQVVPICYSPALTRIARAPAQDIDVLFYGALNERRRALLVAFEGTGLDMRALFGVYGAERDAFIARSKVILNLHAQPTKVFEAVRISYLLANRKAVVTEIDPGTEVDPDFREAVAGVPYDRLVAECCRLVADADARQELEDRGYEIFQRRDMVTNLRRVITEAEEQDKHRHNRDV